MIDAVKRAPAERPAPAVTDELSAEHAVRYALWWCTVAKDRLGHDGRHYDPRLPARVYAALAQLRPAATLADPSRDQIVEAA